MQTVPQNKYERENTMFDMIKIGKRISSLRKKRGMTQMSLANSLGISYQAVSNWERGLAMPDIANLKELAETLGTTVDDILDDSEKARILVSADAGEDVEAQLTPEEFNDMAPLLTADKNLKLLEAVAAPFASEEAAEARVNLDIDDFDDEEYAKMAFEAGDVAMLSLFVDNISNELKAEMFEKAFENGDPAIFSQFMNRITDENAEYYAERAYSEGKVPIFSMLLHRLSREKQEELALRALEEYNIPYVAMLKKHITDDERKKYKKKAFFSGNVALFCILKDRFVDSDDGSDDEDFDDDDE